MVGADDGSYHLLRLPDIADPLELFKASGTGAAPVVLSPDGTRLAYPRRDGLSVVDLLTGSVIATDLPGAPLVVERMVWSPGGEHLAWEASPIDVTDDGFSTSGPPIGGVVSTSPSVLVPFDVPSEDHAVAVGANGTVSTYDGSTFYNGPRGGIMPGLNISPVAVQDADGRLLVGTSLLPDDPDDPVRSVVATVVDVDARTVRTIRGDRDGLSTTPLGWSYDDEALVAVQPDGRGPAVLLATDDGRARTVPTSEDGVPAQISVATDLVTADRPTVDRPAPDWPWHLPDSLLSAAIGVGVAFAVAVLLGLRWAWRRRRFLRVG